MEIVLFVYGTLKRGHANAHMLNGARFIGEAATEPGYTIYEIKGYPAMMRAGSEVVHGEVFAVPVNQIKTLDDFEEGYRRSLIVVNMYGRLNVHAYLSLHVL